jgi:hypothetical protein
LKIINKIDEANKEKEESNKKLVKFFSILLDFFLFWKFFQTNFNDILNINSLNI